MKLRTVAVAAAPLLSLAAGAAISETNFNRIASFATPLNMAEGEDTDRETSAEIIAVTPDGLTLVYTDSPLGALGLIDITDPENPLPLGNIALDGEPTSVAVAGRRAYVAVNTSESPVRPSGHLAVIDIDERTEIARCDIGGQPDSIALDDAGSFVSIAVENERNEDAGDGRTGQPPAGFLAMIEIAGGAAPCGDLRRVELTGLAEVSPEDPEPEFVDINSLGETVVSLQENNHLVIVARDGSIVGHFTAGSVDLDTVDTEEERALTFGSSLRNIVREPDAVKWLDDHHIVTANEGDMDGGSRGFTVFGKDGTVVYESGLSFEHALAEIGHYPERRSGNKGVEPESIEIAQFSGTPLIFVGSERGSTVGVYDASNPAGPELLQLLPSGIGPEGFAAIPERNLLASANEVDLVEDGGVRSHVMIFELREGPASYPHLTSSGIALPNGAPVGWGAISGMAADDDGFIWAVNDGFYALQPTIFKIDPTRSPARIIDRIPVTRGGHPAQKLDMEGIVPAGDGGFWIASEGRTDRLIPHAVIRVGPNGEIVEEIGLPKELAAVERRFGFEGITRIGDTLWLAVQREWTDDPENHTKLVAYNIRTKRWGAVLYPKAEPATGWVGLSEISTHGGFVYVIERDNQIGGAAAIKMIQRIPLGEMVPAELGGPLPVVSREKVRDLIPDLLSTGGYVLDKVEGLAIMPDGTAWVSTDNDGVDGHSGETMFFTIGRI